MSNSNQKSKSAVCDLLGTASECNDASSEAFISLLPHQQYQILAENINDLSPMQYDQMVKRVLNQDVYNESSMKLNNRINEADDIVKLCYDRQPFAEIQHEGLYIPYQSYDRVTGTTEKPCKNSSKSIGVDESTQFKDWSSQWINSSEKEMASEQVQCSNFYDNAHIEDSESTRIDINQRDRETSVMYSKQQLPQCEESSPDCIADCKDSLIQVIQDHETFEVRNIKPGDQEHSVMCSKQQCDDHSPDCIEVDSASVLECKSPLVKNNLIKLGVVRSKYELEVSMLINTDGYAPLLKDSSVKSEDIRSEAKRDESMVLSDGYDPLLKDSSMKSEATRGKGKQDQCMLISDGYDSLLKDNSVKSETSRLGDKLDQSMLISDEYDHIDLSLGYTDSTDGLHIAGSSSEMNENSMSSGCSTLSSVALCNVNGNSLPPVFCPETSQSHIKPEFSETSSASGSATTFSLSQGADPVITDACVQEPPTQTAEVQLPDNKNPGSPSTLSQPYIENLNVTSTLPENIFSSASCSNIQTVHISVQNPGSTTEMCNDASTALSENVLTLAQQYPNLPALPDVLMLASSAAVTSATLVACSSQIPVVGDNSKPLLSQRHMKSYYSSYVSRRFGSDGSSTADIDEIADGLASTFKRKRQQVSPSPYEVPNKKPHLSDSLKQIAESDIDMDKGAKEYESSKNSLPWPSSQSRLIKWKQEAVIKTCEVCDSSFPILQSIKCKNSHTICKTCIEDEIRSVMASGKIFLSCPVNQCKAIIIIDSLIPLLTSFVVDLLRDNLRLKEQKASNKAIKKMQGLVICPHCSCPGLMSDSHLKFICPTCKKSCCRYCKGRWSNTNSKLHDSCLLLGFVGTECLKEVSQLPANWDLNIKPFNQNFVQVDVPLTSIEGSAIAAFYSKTSKSSGISQIFRIQNRRLWEKYVLKRKHVEEEIGAAELKEKYLFHGTNQKNIVSICAEGFDIRVPTANGAVLGKGIYFSTLASYSEKYAGSSGMTFLTRVICGWSQKGSKTLTRPEYHSTIRRMYDSCVDSVTSPTMYTVFDNSQCYPEYLIRFAN